jgi:hypothetical protein
MPPSRSLEQSRSTNSHACWWPGRSTQHLNCHNCQSRDSAPRGAHSIEFEMMKHHPNHVAKWIPVSRLNRSRADKNLVCAGAFHGAWANHPHQRERRPERGLEPRRAVSSSVYARALACDPVSTEPDQTRRHVGGANLSTGQVRAARFVCFVPSISKYGNDRCTTPEVDFQSCSVADLTISSEP